MRGKRTGVLLGATALIAGGVFFTAEHLPLTGPGVAEFLNRSSLGQVILSVMVVNPDVPEVSLPAAPSSPTSGGGNAGGSTASAPVSAVSAKTSIALVTSTTSVKKTDPVQVVPKAAATSSAASSILTSIVTAFADLQAKVNPIPSRSISTATTPTSPSVTTVPTLPAGAVAVVTTPTSLSRNLVSGSVGTDVQVLQRFLNTHGFPIISSGKGSLGNEGTSFGPRTKAALLSFQLAHAKEILGTGSTSQFTGSLGPRTIAYISKLIQTEQQYVSDKTESAVKTGGQSVWNKIINLF